MQISILGCGWLGLSLAGSLITGGYTVKGSTTTEEKVETLRESGIEPYIISLTETGPAGNITAFLKSSEVLIIDIPPKARSGESYPEKIKNLIPHIKDAGIEKVLFVSSTSVYADDNSIVTENTAPNPDSDSGKQVFEAEQLLRKALPETTILRFAGLIGEDRHPVYHLAGRTGIANPEAPVNLIHRNDCIGVIKTIILKNAWGENFNAASPEHPTRKEYYTAKAIELGLEVPEFDEGQESVGKSITSERLTQLLDYKFTSALL